MRFVLRAYGLYVKPAWSSTVVGAVLSFYHADGMTVELYNVTKPASAGRALLFSTILLALACVLAAEMTWTRAREPLGARIETPGWRISFRPPKQFRQGDPVMTSSGPVIPLFGTTGSGREVILAIRRCYVKGNDDPATLCEWLVREHALGRPSHGPWSLSQPTPAKLGPRDGVEVSAPTVPTVVVRAAVFDSGIGYAVALAVNGAPINDGLYRMFDLTCLSIEHSGP